MFLSLPLGAQVDSLIRVFKRTGNDTVRIKALIEIGNTFDNTNPDSALFYHSMAERMAFALNDPLLKGEAMRITGSDHFVLGNYDEALKKLTGVIRLLETEILPGKPDPGKRVLQLLGSSLGSIGNIYLTKGDYTHALEYYFKTLKLSEEQANSTNIAVSLGNIGLAYADMGDPKKALEYYNRSLKIATAAGNTAQANNCLSNIGTLYWDKGNFSLALSYLQKVLYMDEKSGDLFGQANDLGNIGLVYRDMGEALREKCGCKQDSGHFKTALNYFFRSYDLLERTGQKQHAGALAGHIGFLYMQLENYPESEKYMNTELRVALQLNALDDIKQAHLNLSELYEKEKRYTQSLEHYKLFVQYRDSIFNEENTKKTVQAEMNFEFEKKEAAALLEQEKKEAVAAAEKKKQKIILFSVSGFGLLVLAFAVFAWRSFLQKKRANIEISTQKNFIEE